MSHGAGRRQALGIAAQGPRLTPQPPWELSSLVPCPDRAAHQLLEGSELLGQVAEPRPVQLQPAQAGHRLHVLREVAALRGGGGRGGGGGLRKPPAPRGEELGTSA